MIQKPILIGLLLVAICSYAQAELPKIIPPSPTAYELGKYGNIPMNESTGMANIAIPLHTYSTPNIQVPISLSYTTSGIKVDQVSSWVGMGWNLNAGGVITRMIKGKADDLSTTTFPDKSTLKDLRETDPTTYYNFIYDIGTGYSNLDAEPDIFNFNFNGYAGSFIVNENAKPVIIKNDSSLQIEQSMYMGFLYSGFIITTPDGIKYYFGDTQVEYTSQRNDCNTDENIIFNTKTAWYLFKIKHPKGDEIYFNYKDSYFSYKSGFSQSYRKVSNVISYSNQYCGTPQKIKNDLEGPDLCLFYTYIKGKNLVSITSNRNTDKAVFNSTKGRLDIEDAYRINNLEVYTGDQFIKGYKFNQLDIKSNVKYSNEPPKLQSPGNHYRLFLDSVEELDQSRNSINGKSYIFSYNTPEALPPRLSFAQDFLGFYNNKGNKSFLPNHKESMFWDVTTGNRNSDFRFVQKGILTKVTYPTKGYTQLEYQPIVEIITDNSSFVNIPIYFELDSSESPVVETNGPMILVRETFENDITMSVDHDTELVLNIDSGAEVGDKLFVNLIVENITTGEQEMYKSYLKDVKDIKHSIRFVKDNTYRFILESKFANHNYQKVFASLNFKYVIEEYQEADPNNKSGIRVKKIKNKASATAPEEVTTYFYNFKERIHEYSLKKFVIQDFISHEYREYICSIGGVPEIKPNNLATYTEHLLKDNSIDGLYTNFVSNYKNKVITISKGENFEAGGIEKEFRANGDVASRTVFFGKELTPMPSINFSLWDGTLMKETFFTKKNEVIKNTKETVNTYIVDESKTRKIQAYQANNRYINKKTVRGSSKGLSGIDIIYYPVFCKWLSLGSTTTIQYDTTGQEILSTTTNYSYETGLAGLPSSRTIINSRGHNEETRMYYPDDVTLTTSLGNEVLSPDEFQTIDRLKTGKSESRIGIPLQTVVNKNGAKTTQRTLYKTWFNSTQPEFVQTLKGAYNSSTNPMQNRIQYHKYDHKGNPLEVSKADGTHIMYIWGYQNQYPIAKIENASYTGIPTTATALINQLKVTSDNEDTVGEENTMRNLFKNLREHDYFKDAQITGYTYDPLIGVTSMTDPKGYTIYYEYDAFDRLQFIKDTEGNLVSERKYNYKNQ